MTVSVQGVAGSLDTNDLARLLRRAVNAAAAGLEMYVTGLVATASGTNLSITSGDAYQPGTLLESSATVTIAVPTNATGSPRIDLLCAKVDYTGTEATAGSFFIKQGTPAGTPTPPSLTADQVVGDHWLTPLKQYTVAAGTSIATQLIDVRPGQSAPPTTRSDPAAETHSINGSGLATITHGLGAAPTFFEATVLNSNWLATPVWGSRTTTTIQVAVRALSTGALVTSTSGSFIWKAEA